MVLGPEEKSGASVVDKSAYRIPSAVLVFWVPIWFLKASPK